MKEVCLSLLVVLLLVPFIHSQEQSFEQIISNSEDWKDVYSAMHYANLNSAGGDFLVSTSHGSLLLNELNKNTRIRIVSSSSIPYIINYPGIVNSRGFESVDEIVVESANLKLIEEMPEISNFIVVRDSYGFNAIAVASYASLTNSWVFLSNSLNADEIDSILSRRNIDKLIIYGNVDREVTETLSKYDPEIIDEGDRFKDNIEIVKKYREINPTKQVALTNGEFIEKEIMKGASPVLFTGKENVPDQIRDFLKESDIEVGVLIGNDLIGAATNIRRSAGISVMVKFARGARSPSAGISAVEGLDLFPLPTPSILLSIHSIKYNKVNSQLELTYKSDSNLPVYFVGTITLNSNGEIIRVGDVEPIFIAPGDFRTVIYSTNLTSLEGLKAEISTLFGESESALDRILTAEASVDIIEVIDQCVFDEEDIKKVSYNKQKEAFVIKIKNDNGIDCWVDVELDVIIGSNKRIIGTEGSVRIPSGKTKNIELFEELTEGDLEKNPVVDLTAYFGEREDSLVHIFKSSYPLDVQTFSIITYTIIIFIIIIIILLFIIFLIKRREEDEEE